MISILSIGYLLVYNNPERYKNRLISYLKNISVILCSLFIIVVLIEVYLHLAQPEFMEFQNSIVGDLSDYKSQGCDYVNEKTFIKPEGAFRILSIGDSFAVSEYKIQKNYHNYLSAALKSAGYNHIDLVNAGMQSEGPGYYWHILEKYGDSWKPDLVLVGFFVGNDFEEMDLIVHRGPFIRESQDPYTRWRGYLKFQNFWLYRVAKGKLTLMVEKRLKAKEKKEAQVTQESSFSNMAFLYIERKRIWIFEKDKRADLDRLWQEKSNRLLKFKEWSAQRGVPLVILIFPDQFQVDRNLRQEICQAYGLSADNFDPAYPNRLISEYCRQHGIDCLDMLGPFQEQGGARELYKLRDTHWNEAGNRLAGELIFNYLTANRLLQPH